MARKDSTGDTPAKQGRIAQLRQTYRMARRSDRWVGWISLGVVVAVLAVAALVGIFVGPLWLWLVAGTPIALLAGATVFGRRVERAAYAQIEGQPGAAAAALGTLRRGWDVTPVVGASKYQDVVHRAVGRPGIVLVGEGQVPHRVANLVAQEKKRHQRVAPEAPVVELIVGRDEGQVPLPKLARRLNKLPRRLRPAEVTELRQRLRALGTQPIGIPKGPMPKGVRVPRGGMPGR